MNRRPSTKHGIEPDDTAACVTYQSSEAVSLTPFVTSWRMPPKASKGERNEWVDPVHIRFMHSKIRPVFSDGKSVQQTLDDILAGKVKVEDLPQIVIIQQDENLYYSMNNRRLWVLKKLREKGALKDNKVLVRVRPQPETRRLKDKFSIDRCSDTAKFMREKPSPAAKDGAQKGGKTGGVATAGAAAADEEESEEDSNAGDD